VAVAAGRRAWWERLARYWRAETGVFLVVWFALMVAGRSLMFRDPGTFWHTVLGRQVLASGRLVVADPFSFTCGGRPWFPHSWLAECLMAVVHGLGGFDGLLLVTATTLAGLYAWTAHRLIRTGLHPLPTALFVGLAIAASTTHFHVRPHIATIVLLGLTFGLLGGFEAGRIGLGRLFGLVPLFILWSNLHGGMPAGLATLGLAVLGWGVAWLIGWESPVSRPRQVLWLGVLVVSCGLAALVNPYGRELPRTWLAITGSPLLPQIIQEHAPPRPDDGRFWMIVALGLAYGGTLASTWPRRPRVTWLIPLVWFALALSRIRHAPLFAITALVALADFLPHSRLAAWLARPGRDLFSFSRPSALGWRPTVLPLAVLLAAVMLQAAGVRVPVLGRGWARLDPADWPVDLLPVLRRVQAEHPEGTRIFNDFELGGFLIYHTPGLKVFIDDRCELYGDARLAQYWDAQTRDAARIDRWCTDERIPYALVRTGSRFDHYLARSAGWTVVQPGVAATLYARAPGQPGIAARVGPGDEAGGKGPSSESRVQGRSNQNENETENQRDAGESSRR
jgi:hypothetical protein